MSRHVPAGVVLTCMYCGDEIVIPAAVTLRGSVCADCGPEAEDPQDRAAAAGGPMERQAPTKQDQPVQPTPVAPAPQPEERDLFDAGPVALCKSIDIEEWVYFAFDFIHESPQLLANPRDIDAINLKAAFELRSLGQLRVAFRVVVSWLVSIDASTPRRQVGAAFWVTEGRDRAEAFIAAKTHAHQEAKRLKALGPFGYLPAREIQWSGNHDSQ